MLSSARSEKTQARAALVAALWTAGRAAWRLTPTPHKVYEDVRRWGNGVSVVFAHRNFWKTMLAITIADEQCRQQANARWAIVFKTKEHASKVIKPLMAYYLRDCPEGLRPRALKSDYVWQYPNGSSIDFYGADHEHIETARGRGFHGVIFDEAAHQERLEENIRSIMLPCLAKLGGGPLLAISTASMEPSHYFEALVEQARVAGRLAYVPASQNPDLDDSWRAARAAECGGFDSLAYRVEYECEFALNPATTVLPNVTAARIEGSDGRPPLVRALPLRFDREWYCAMDIGGKHLTFCGWGYYEPEGDCVFIARELAHRNASPLELAREIRKVEDNLFPVVPPEFLYRWADNNNLFLLHDLKASYRLPFLATRKDQKMAQVASLRQMIDDGRLAIDPGCTLLLSTLRKAQWRKTGKTDSGFAEDPEIGHADGLDMTLYLIRNVKRRAYPKAPPTLMEQVGVPSGERPLKSAALRKMRTLLEREPGWDEVG
jgi:hypothetical protein